MRARAQTHICKDIKIKSIPGLVDAKVEVGVAVVKAQVVRARTLVALHLDLDLPLSLAELKRKIQNKSTDKHADQLALKKHHVLRREHKQNIDNKMQKAGFEVTKSLGLFCCWC